RTHFGCHGCSEGFQIEEPMDSVRDLAHDTNIPTASKLEDGTIEAARNVGRRCLGALCKRPTATVRDVAEGVGHAVVRPGEEGWDERLSAQSPWLPSDSSRTAEEVLGVEYAVD